MYYLPHPSRRDQRHVCLATVLRHPHANTSLLYATHYSCPVTQQQEQKKEKNESVKKLKVSIGDYPPTHHRVSLSESFTFHYKGIIINEL